MAQNTYRSEDTPKAKKPRKKKQRKEGGKKINPLAFLSDKRLQLSVGLFLMVFAIFLFIGFTSHLFTGNIDQSEADSTANIVQKGKEVKNWLGYFGFSLARFFMDKAFGVFAFCIVPVCFLFGYQIVFKTKIKHLKSITIAAIFLLFWGSSILGYYNVTLKKGMMSSFVAGAIGFELANLFESLLGFGALLLFLFVAAVFVIFFFNINTFIKNKLNPSAEDEFEDERIEDEHKNFVQETNDEMLSSAEELEEKDEDQEQAGEENLEGIQLQETATFEPEEESNKEEVPFELELNNEPSEKKEDPVASDELIVEAPTGDEELVVNSSQTQDENQDAEEDAEFEVDEGVEEEESQDGVSENYDPTLDLPHYKYPSIDLLRDMSGSKVTVTREELEANKDKIVTTLGNYKIGISSIKATIGPTVTLYEIVPEAGVKISKIKNLEDDIALSLAALGIRIIAPIPGKGTIGIEVPNTNREIVAMRSVMNTEKFMHTDMQLPIVFGKTISNEIFMVDLVKMPHILMAGATGQGKSVGINVLLASLLYKKHPSQLKFVLVDPKKVELSIYSTIEKHFLAALPDADESIITDTKKVIHTLNSLCTEMDTRYDLLKDAGCRNIKEYNKKFVERRLNPHKGHHFMPYIVVVIDELADLMMTAGKEVETPIARLAQLARAIGIHLVVATQRPSVNVITGVIKANFPARISFKVTSKIDSRTILDAGGADQLIGMGDMLFSQGSDVIRIQCAFVDTPEVDAVCEFIGEQDSYMEPYQLPEYVDENEGPKGDLADRDSLFEEAARMVVRNQSGSTSLIQRKMKLGYNRAGRIMDQLEIAGVVGSFAGSKAREVLIKDEMSLEQLLNELNGL